MVAIELISNAQLLKDKQESIIDISNCEQAILFNILTYSGGSVQERLDVNKKIVVKIDEELQRRNI